MVTETPDRHFINLDGLNDRSIIVDAGAASGNSIKTFRRYSEINKCKIFAIECNRSLIGALKRRRFKNVTICEKALVGQGSGDDVIFYQHLGLPDYGNIYERAAWRSKRKFKGIKEYKVKVLRINDIFDELNVDKIDYMKVDIEGSELEVIETMSEETASKIGQISMEFHHRSNNGGRERLEGCIQSLGFKKVMNTKQEVFFERQRKLFIDAGVGKSNSEAWRKEKDFTIIGLEPATNKYDALKSIYPGKLLNVAALDREGRVACWENPKYGVVLFMDEDKINIDGNFKKTTKRAIKLDNLEWKGFHEIHIWADIEGSELMMLEGATEMLSSGKVKWINLEIRKNAITDGWPTAHQIYSFLDRYGFEPNVSYDSLRETKHRDVIFTRE